VTPDGRRARRLGTPKPTSVVRGEGGSPRSIAGREVDSVREEWVVEDRWWTGKPLRRRYFEVVLLDGRNVVVFRDLVRGGWFLQRS
jgi:hypothetical protein